MLVHTPIHHRLRWRLLDDNSLGLLLGVALLYDHSLLRRRLRHSLGSTFDGPLDRTT